MSEELQKAQVRIPGSAQTMYTYRCGGKTGQTRTLVVADDQVAIRTRGIPYLAEAVQDEENRRRLP